MSLIVPGMPDNFRLPHSVRGARMVESDVFDICKRIKELDTHLYVVYQEGHDEPFVVMESCTDFTERMVKRYKTLEAHIITDLQRMLRIPFEQRIAKKMAEIDAENEAAENAYVESEQTERIIHDMRKALRDSNLADPVTPTFFKGKD